MRNLTSAIAVLLSAVIVLARAPLHRRATIPPPPPTESLESDELASPEAKYIMTPLPTLLAYSGVSFFALYLLVILRRRCKIRITGRRLTFGRASTRMGALELDGSEVELLPTVAEPGVREVRMPLSTVLDDSRSEEVSDDITGELVKPADAPSMPLIPLSTLGQLPPPSPFSPPASPVPIYAHPSSPYSVHDKDPVSPYASPPSRSVGLPLSLPLIPSTPIRQSRLGSPRPSVSKSRSSPGFNTARFATYPQRSKSSPPLPRRTKLGHGRSDSHSSLSDGAEAIMLQPIHRVVSPSPLPHSPHGFTLLPPPHIALSRSKSTGSDLIDLTTPSITPSASMASLVRVARVETESVTTIGTKDVVENVLPDVLSVANKDRALTPPPLEMRVKEEEDRRSEVDLVDIRFRASPSAPEAISLSLSGSSTSPVTSTEAPRPASLMVLDDAPVSASQSTGSMSTDSSSSSSPLSPSMELFVPHSVHSTPGTTPMRPEFMFTEQIHAGATHEQTIGWERQPEKETKAVSKWESELPSFNSGSSVDWHDHSDVWGSPSPAPPLRPMFTREEELGTDIELMAFGEDSTHETKVESASAGEDTAVGEDLISFEDENEEEGESMHVVEVAVVGEEVEKVAEGEVIVLQETEISVPETLAISAVLTNPATNEHEDDEKENDEVDNTLFAHAYDDNNDYAHDFYDDKHDESTFNISNLPETEQREWDDEDEDVFAEKIDEGDADITDEDNGSDAEHPDPDLLPLPLDVPPPMSPAGRFYLELVRSASTAGREEEVAVSSNISSPQLLPALVISAPTPSRPRTLNSELCIPDTEKPFGDDVKTPSPSPSPTPSRIQTPLQTPTPPSSPPPLVSPARRTPLMGLPLVTKSEVEAKIASPEAGEGEVREKENKLPAWSVRAADAPPLGLSSGNFTLKEKRSFSSKPKASPVEAQAQPLYDAHQSAEKSSEEFKVVESVSPIPSPSEIQDIEPEVMSKVLPENPIAPEPIQLTRSLPGSFDDSHDTPALQPSSTPETAESVSSATPSSPKPAEVEVARPRPQRPIRSAIDIALAMQLRPGIGIGADPAWMVRFLMAMFGWFAVLISGSGEMDALLVGRR